MLSRVVQIFTSDQWGRETVRLVEGDEAIAMAKRTESILENSMRMLSSHERVLSPSEFKTFSIKHRQLVLKAVEVKQRAHEQRNRSVFSASPAGRDSESIDRDAFRIFREAQIYHQDLLTASRRAEIAQEQGLNDSTQHDSSQTDSSAEPKTTFYSVIWSKSSTVDRQPFTAIVHVRPETDGSTDDDDDWFREIYILENPRKTVVMFNSNPCFIKQESNPLKGSSALEMSHMARLAVNATDSTYLPGYELIKNTENENGTSWFDSFINGLTRLGVGIGADML